MRILRIAALCSGLLLGACVSAGPVQDMVLAAQMDDPATIERLLKKGASSNTVDPITGQTLLILALRDDSHRVIEQLLAAKDLQTELAAPNGNTALMMAAFKRNKQAAEALLARGAAVNRPGWSPLHYAAASGDAEIARLLLARGARIDALAPNDQTPLMVAAREGQEASVDALLSAGANTVLKNGEGLTAIQIAELADKPRISASIESHGKRKTQQ